ncbi:MAG: DUF554 domain-containing protein [Bacteroidaceae bacterium]|nr:DUF554 domain-containing protein [Bacteroidaceae bacterium]
MIGTIVNTAAILAGSAIGATMKRGIKPQYQQVVFVAIGLCSIALGLNACVQYLPKSHYPVLFILSMAMGGLVGASMKLSERFSRLVDGKQTATADGKQTAMADGKPRLSEGLSTAILLFCIGTFSMLGPVNSAILDDNTYLYTNATLDFITSMVIASTYGYGIMLAAPVLFCWQGMFYLVAKLSASAISNELITELSVVGGLLIMGSGLGILKIKDCKTLNLLPALLVPILFFMFKALFVAGLAHWLHS